MSNKKANGVAVTSFGCGLVGRQRFAVEAAACSDFNNC
jgi:hypothetical protein